MQTLSFLFSQYRIVRANFIQLHKISSYILQSDRGNFDVLRVSLLFSLAWLFYWSDNWCCATLDLYRNRNRCGLNVYQQKQHHLYPQILLTHSKINVSMRTVVFFFTSSSPTIVFLSPDPSSNTIILVFLSASFKISTNYSFYCF